MKKIMSILLTLAMVCTFAVVPVSAEITQATDGYYEIYTADDYVAFVTIANSNLSANARLMADIDLSGKTAIKTIGSAGSNEAGSNPYIGTFDGNKKVIRNLTIDHTASSNKRSAAMFASLGKTAVVKDLGIENAKITVTFEDLAYIKVAGIVGNSYGAKIQNCYVKNSEIVANAKVRAVEGMGAIAGMANASTRIENCYAIDNTIKYKDNAYTGASGLSAFVGYMGSNATAEIIKNSYAKDNTITNVANDEKAGFVAYNKDGKKDITTNSYTDQKLAKDGTSVILIESDDAWETLASTLNGADGTVWKDVANGSPAFTWERTLAVNNVNIAATENGTVTADASENVPEGTTVTLTVTPDAGYMIGEVKVNGEAISAPYTFTMPAEAVTVTATFVEETKYAVNIAATENGTVTVDPTSFVPGATVTLTVTPANEGFTAVVYKDGEVLADPYSFTMPKADVEITATFTAPWDGKGTEADPFMIREAQDLKDIVNTLHYEGVYFELANDIDCGDVFTTPIANAYNDTTRDNRYFSGILDGKNYVIKNFNPTATSRYVAVFSHLKNATIKNLGVENANSALSGSTIANVSTLAALVESSTISNCYAKDSKLAVVKSSGNPRYAGGLVAEADSTTFTNCYTQNITISQTGDASFTGCAGGFVGFLKGTSTATNCYSANIKYKDLSTSGHVAFFAREGANAQVTNCFRTGRGADDANAVLKTATELHSAILLGSAFVADFDYVNGGYPMLAWEVTEAPAYKIILTGVGKDENGAITNVTFETYDDTASGKVYVAVMNGKRFVKAVTADMTAGTVDIEDITLADGETINVFVWENVNPLMFAEKGLN